ncbi:hypothetical protein OLMES_5238 [Oleiphilus messinensis]|uniref:Uncharacterized protein n=2 Tax=Oleiphilus messinensis TaxID=141451 RepID=A0A1Y0IFA5_9GAMM|nr:hypothetical protein OLMES_5238 [Oleiphilus messinensis]
MQNLGVHFYYSGYITEQMLLSVGEALKKPAIFAHADKKVRQTAFALFVEQIQNIMNYSFERCTLDDGTEFGRGVIAMGEEGDRFYIDCGNPVAISDVARIDAALQDIQALDRPELKAQYRSRLHGAIPDGSKGAGVGLIEIALRAKSDFSFGFVELDEKRAFYNLKVYI